MARQPRELSSGMVNGLAVLAAAMIATLFLFKAPHNSMACLLILSPCVFLFAIWNSYRSLSQAMDAANAGGLKSSDTADSKLLRERAGLVAVFGLAGVSLALSMGFILGHMTAH